MKLARFGDIRTASRSLRHNSNVLAVTGAAGDYDGGKIPVAEAVEKLTLAGVLAIVHTSPSHTEDTPRWRVICPFSTELSPERHAKMVSRINGLLGGILAGESWTLSQAYYYGGVRANPSHEVHLVDGTPIDLIDELEASETGKPNASTPAAQPRLEDAPATPSTATGNSYGRAALSRACRAIRAAPDGAKHPTINREAFGIGQRVGAGDLDEAEAFADLAEALETLAPFCKSFPAAQATLRRAFEAGKANPGEFACANPDRGTRRQADAGGAGEGAIPSVAGRRGRPGAA